MSYLKPSKTFGLRSTQLLILVISTQLVVCSPFRLNTSPSAPDPRYQTYEQIRNLFTSWSEEYADIFHTEYIGVTGSGRDSILAARISNKSLAPGNCPTLIFHAALHSNECNGTNAIIEMMKHLLEGYGGNDYYTPMINNLNLWFIPIVNVDGHHTIYNGFSGWTDWRKTLRDNDGNNAFSGFADGVDLNRNWDHRWHQYPQLDPSHSMYKGPSPFSEVETVHLRNFILRENPLFLTDFHSPGVVTPGNVIFWPWVVKETRRLGVDAQFYAPIAERFASRTITEVDSVYFEKMASYDILPKEQCWVYANTGLCVLLMEISSQFWWEGPIVDTIAHRVADGSFYLLERALAGPGLTGRVTETGTGRTLIAEIRVAEAHDPDIGPRLSNQAGRYWRLLNEGKYTVTAHLNGLSSTPQSVTISRPEWVTADFEFPAEVLQSDPAPNY